jgi:hypothetical protein
LDAFHAIEYLKLSDGRTIEEAKNVMKRSPLDKRNKIAQEIKGIHDQLIIRIINSEQLHISTPKPWSCLEKDNIGRINIKDTIGNIIYNRFLLFLGSVKIKVLEILVVGSRVTS